MPMTTEYRRPWHRLLGCRSYYAVLAGHVVFTEIGGEVDPARVHCAEKRRALRVLREAAQ